ncbi:MAG: hypothetical protein WCF33_20600 [Pseudonocardiaceae bacterium]
MQPAGAAEVHHCGAAVVADDARVPQPVQQIGVVAVADERLGIGQDDVRVEEGQHGELVIASDRGQHRADGGVGERAHKDGETTATRLPGTRLARAVSGGRIRLSHPRCTIYHD